MSALRSENSDRGGYSEKMHTCSFVWSCEINKLTTNSKSIPRNYQTRTSSYPVLPLLATITRQEEKVASLYSLYD